MLGFNPLTLLGWWVRIPLEAWMHSSSCMLYCPV